MSSADALLHVAPGRRGAWIVTEPGTDRPLSEHPEAAAALRAASDIARRRGGGEVFVHDHYHHVRQHRFPADR